MTFAFSSLKKLGEKLGAKLGEKLNRSQIKIIELIQASPAITISELSNKLEISTTAVENNIRKLKEKFILERIGSDKGGYWKILVE